MLVCLLLTQALLAKSGQLGRSFSATRHTRRGWRQVVDLVFIPTLAHS